MTNFENISLEVFLSSTISEFGRRYILNTEQQGKYKISQYNRLWSHLLPFCYNRYIFQHVRFLLLWKMFVIGIHPVNMYHFLFLKNKLFLLYDIVSSENTSKIAIFLLYDKYPSAFLYAKKLANFEAIYQTISLSTSHLFLMSDIL